MFVPTPSLPAIRLSGTLMDELFAYCRSQSPKEGCGLLYGQTDGNDIIVTRFIGITNAAPIPERHFLLEPTQWIECLCRQDADELIGLFHSHPESPAVPSKEDLDLQFEFQAYMIISLLPETSKTQPVRCYQPRLGSTWRELMIMIHNG